MFSARAWLPLPQKAMFIGKGVSRLSHIMRRTYVGEDDLTREQLIALCAPWKLGMIELPKGRSRPQQLTVLPGTSQYDKEEIGLVYLRFEFGPRDLTGRGRRWSEYFFFWVPAGIR